MKKKESENFKMLDVDLYGSNPGNVHGIMIEIIFPQSGLDKNDISTGFIPLLSFGEETRSSRS